MMTISRISCQRNEVSSSFIPSSSGEGQHQDSDADETKSQSQTANNPAAPHPPGKKCAQLGSQEHTDRQSKGPPEAVMKCAGSDMHDRARERHDREHELRCGRG